MKGKFSTGKALRLIVLLSVGALGFVWYYASQDGQKEAPAGERKTGADFGDDERSRNEIFRKGAEERMAVTERTLAAERESNAKLKELVGLLQRDMAEKDGGGNLAATLLTKISEHEMGEVPAYLSTHVREAVVYLEALALSDGKVFPDQTIEPLASHLKSLLPTNTATPETFQSDVRTMARVCRVRPDPLSEKLINELPGIVARRDLASIPRADMQGIIRLITSLRETLPTYTSGQLLAMASQVASVPAGKYAKLGQEILEEQKGTTTANAQGSVVVGGLSYERNTLSQALLLLAPHLLDVAAASPVSEDGPALAMLIIANRDRLVDRAFGSATEGVTATAALANLESDLRALIPQAKRIAQLQIAKRRANDDTSAGRMRVVNAAAAGALLGDLASNPTQLSAQTTDRLDKVQATAGELNRLLREDHPWDGLGELYATVLRIPGSDTSEATTIRPENFAGIPNQWDFKVEQARRIAAAVIALGMKNAPEFKDHWEREALLLAALTVARTDSGIATNEITQAVAEITTAHLATLRALDAARATLVPSYRAWESDDRIWSGVLPGLPSISEVAVATTLARGKPTWSTEQVDALATKLQPSTLTEIETRLVRALLAGRVHRRMLESGIIAQDTLIRDADDHVHVRVVSLVRPPYSQDRLSRIEDQLLREALDILSGRRRKVGSEASSLDARAEIARADDLAPVRTLSPGTASATDNNQAAANRSNMPLVGTAHHQVQTKLVQIPALSYGTAHLLHGVTVEVGQSKQIVAQLDATWRGPSGATLQMPHLLMVGTATVQAGPSRLDITVDALSYSFGDRQNWYSKTTGYVVDNTAQGLAGVPGDWDWHAERALPLAVLAGAGDAFSKSLINATQGPQISIVNSTGNTTVEQPDSPVRDAALAGAGGGVGAISEFAKTNLAYFKPTVTVPSGLAVTICVTTPVTVDVPPEAWTSETYRDLTPGF